MEKQWKLNKVWQSITCIVRVSNGEKVDRKSSGWNFSKFDFLEISIHSIIKLSKTHDKEKSLEVYRRNKCTRCYLKGGKT